MLKKYLGYDQVNLFKVSYTLRSSLEDGAYHDFHNTKQLEVFLTPTG